MEPRNLGGVKGSDELVEGRRFRVTRVTERAAAGGAPAFHQIEARAEPALRVDLALPLNWNGRLCVQGNGGYAGEAVDTPFRDLPRNLALALGYAVAGSNTGHDADVEPLATFASDPDKLVDYAHRAVHQTTLLAKALLHRIYGEGPRYSYFQGCSTGGRQALIAAQRYPDDFDGIIAGAPVLDFTGSQLWSIRTAQFLADTGIGAAEMAVVAAAINRFHGADEDRPFILDDPIHSGFDIRRDVPVCDGDAPTPGTLTRKQAEAIAAVYAPADIGGRMFPGFPIGAEAIGLTQPGFPPTSGWEGWVYRSDEGFFAGAPDGVRAAFGETFVTQMLGFKGGWRDFDFSPRALGEIERFEALLNATDADLGPFAARGGKLMLYHGLADPALNAARTIAYFEEARHIMGKDKVDAFARFYPMPGMFHCFGGYGPDQFDMLTPLVAWVEAGTAPGTLVATKGPSDAPEMSRPLYPYPKVAKYSGSGDPRHAGSYEAADTLAS